MRPLVEDAGEPLSAGWLSRLRGLTERARGVRRVGVRRLRWELDDADVVTVSHPPAGGDGAPIRYSFRLLFTGLPSGVSRWWWACPGCSRRVGVLYLPAGRDRLGCRVCCGLLYRSQYTRGKARRRRRRPAVNGVIVIRRWVWLPPYRQ
jgi:hypothetical protein